MWSIHIEYWYKSTVSQGRAWAIFVQCWHCKIKKLLQCHICVDVFSNHTVPWGLCVELYRMPHNRSMPNSVGQKQSSGATWHTRWTLTCLLHSLPPCPHSNSSPDTKKCLISRAQMWGRWSSLQWRYGKGGRGRGEARVEVGWEWEVYNVLEWVRVWVWGWELCCM